VLRRRTAQCAAGRHAGFHTTPAHPALGSLWDDIDFDNYDVSDHALAVIERFTRWRWCRADYQGLYDLELGYLPRRHARDRCLI
jgi:hypothetical protein